MLKLIEEKIKDILDKHYPEPHAMKNHGVSVEIAQMIKADLLKEIEKKQ